jgi:hypothetical protein
MKLAIMQPYFFPYVGYFSLMYETKTMILIDEVQFRRKSWMTRNRIYNPHASFTFIHIPINKAPLHTKIKDIQISQQSYWREQLIKQLSVYEKAPYYNETINLIKSLMEFTDPSLVKWHQHCIQKINQYLQLDCKVEIFSELNIEIEDVYGPDEWSLNICKSLGAIEYVNPPQGIGLFNEEKFTENEIELTFLQNNLSPYPQFTDEFQSGLSIIDVLMFNHPKEALRIISDYQTYTKKDKLLIGEGQA